jgi:uncharacterized protein (TIGR02996 family)
MSFHHWDPDIRLIPCLGCDDWIQPEDLVRYQDPYARSGPSWHPYHFWCCRIAPPLAMRPELCADCGAPIPDADVRAMMDWRATYPVRVGQQRGTRTSRPAGWCIVAITLPHEWRRTSPPESERQRENRVNRTWELVHVDCPDDEAQPFADPDERLVYADWLEQHGQLDRAQFVRIADRPGDNAELRALRQRLSSSRCRRVIQTCRLVELRALV